MASAPSSMSAGAGSALRSRNGRRLDHLFPEVAGAAVAALPEGCLVDCVVGGFRGGRLLLGLHDGDGLLHHVGETVTLSPALWDAALQLLSPPGPAFTGRPPGLSDGGRPPGTTGGWSASRSPYAR